MSNDIHAEKLSIWSYEFEEGRNISDFEKKGHVDYILTRFKEQNEEAIEKMHQAEHESDLIAEGYQSALNAMADEDWGTLSEIASNHGVWDPDHDPKHFKVDAETGEEIA